MNKVKPTKLQRATLEILKENPDMPLGKAMITAGYAENSSGYPKQNFLERKGVGVAIDEYKDVLRSKGITEQKLAEKTAEWLDAKKVSTSLTEPDRIVPDYQTQLKAGEMVREDFGLKQNVNSAVTINFNKMANTQKQEYGI